MLTNCHGAVDAQFFLCEPYEFFVQGFVAIPKSKTPARVEANAPFGFTLNEADLGSVAHVHESG